MGRTGVAGKRRLERRAEMVGRFCNIDSTKKVLEIGCGTGTLTACLARTGAQITATDLFPKFLEIARSRNNAGNVVFQAADAETLEEFSQDSFDVVCGLSILHHLDINKALNSIFRVLKPGGTIAFSEPNMLNPQVAIQKNIPLVKKLLGDSPDETAFFSWKIKKAVEKTGFKEVKITPFDFLHPATPDNCALLVEKVGLFFESVPLVCQIASSLFISAKK